MKTVAVIAEFNPFHKGHAAILRKAKEMSGSDFCVVVMSGDFVQRGEPAIAEKYTRTRMALANGADLVLELPLYYSLGSAEYFAGGAVNLLNALNVCDCLVFGSESADMDRLQKAAKILNEEPPAFKLQLQTAIKNGMDFPTARMHALSFCLPEEEKSDAELLESPNNLLGMEYLKMMIKTASSYKAMTVPRTSGVTSSEVREMLLSSEPRIRRTLFPESCAMILRDYTGQTGYCFADINAITPALKHMLALGSAQGAAKMADVGKDLAQRIYAELPDFKDIEQFLDVLHTKDITMSRVKRALLHIFLAMPAEKLELFVKNKTVYARALGFRKSAQPLLNHIKNESKIPLITKLAQADKLLKDDALARELLAQDIRASFVYDQLFMKDGAYPIRSEFEKSPAVV